MSELDTGRTLDTRDARESANCQALSLMPEEPVIQLLQHTTYPELRLTQTVWRSALQSTDTTLQPQQVTSPTTSSGRGPVHTDENDAIIIPWAKAGDTTAFYSDILGLSSFFENLQSVMSYQQIDTPQPFSPANIPAPAVSPSTTVASQQEH